MSVNKFKVGDIVKCVDNDCLYHGNLTVGNYYSLRSNSHTKPIKEDE